MLQTGKTEVLFFPATNLIWFGRGSNPSIHSEVSAANHLNHSTAIDVHVSDIYIYIYIYIYYVKLQFIPHREHTLCPIQ